MVKIYKDKYPRKKNASLTPPTKYIFVYEAIKKIPWGKVISFQRLAYMIGNGIVTQGIVFNAIKLCKNPETINLHRVVCADGGLSLVYPLGGIAGQKAKLEAEGIAVTIYNKVDLDLFGFE